MVQHYGNPNHLACAHACLSEMLDNATRFCVAGAHFILDYIKIMRSHAKQSLAERKHVISAECVLLCLRWSYQDNSCKGGRDQSPLHLSVLPEARALG